MNSHPSEIPSSGQTQTIAPTATLETTKTQWLNIFMLWFAGIYVAMQFAKFSASYDQLLTHYQASTSIISIALSCVGIMGLIFGTVAGVLSGRIGHKKVLLTSLLIGSLLSWWQSFLPHIELLVVSRIIEGLSHLGVVVSAPTLIIALSEKRHQTMLMGLWGSFFGVAFALMGWLGNPLLEESGLSQLYQAHALLAVPIFIYLLLRLPSLKSHSDDSNSKANPAPSIHQFLTDLTRLYCSFRTLLPGLVFLFHTSMFVSLLTFIPRLSESESVRYQLSILLPLISIGGTFLAGLIAQYWLSPHRLTLISYLGVALFSVLTFSYIDHSVLFFSFANCLLLFSGLVAGSAFAMIPFLLKSPDQQAQSNGAVAQLGNLGATIGPPLFAYALASYDNLGMLILIISLCLFAMGLALYGQRYRQAMKGSSA